MNHPKETIDLKQAAKDLVYLRSGIWRDGIVPEWATQICEYYNVELNIYFIINIVSPWIVDEFAKM